MPTSEIWLNRGRFVAGKLFGTILNYCNSIKKKIASNKHKQREEPHWFLQELTQTGLNMWRKGLCVIISIIYYLSVIYK